MAKMKAQWKYDADGAVVAVERRALGRRKAVACSEWLSFGGLDSLMRRARMGDIDADGLAAVQVLDDYHLRISARTLAAFDETQAARLGLAETTPARLDIQTQSIPSSDRFKIRIQFKDKNGRATRRRVEGATVIFGSGHERLPEPLYSLYQAANALAEPIVDRDQRFERISELCAVLNETLGTVYSSDAFLDRLDIAYASHLSIQTNATSDGMEVRPILFGKQAAQYFENPDLEFDENQEGEGDADADVATLNEGESLLDGKGHATFLKCLDEVGARPALKLDRGRYVYMPPAVKAATQAVVDANKMDRDGLEDFLRNPRPYMRDVIEKLGADGDPETIFVPTEEYSARVQGIGYWKAPVLPWIVNQTNSWIPERCGIKIGGRLIELTPTEAAKTLEAIHEAEKQGLDTVNVAGEPVEISNALKRSLGQVASLPQAGDPDENADNQDGVLEGDKPDYRKHFLVIEENFEDLFYAERRGTELQVSDLVAAVVPPTRLKATLKSYQQDGLNWLSGAESAGHRGALLADDMGLGKTLQTLCAMALGRQRRDGQTKPSLVVAPTALIQNWIAEMDRHFEPGAFGSICIATGPDLKRLRQAEGRDTQTGAPSLDTEHLRKQGTVLTTYETLRDYHLSFAKVPFHYVVFDEIQKAKNPETQLARAAKTVNAEFWIGLTGTPVENRLHDLWSITDILWPGLLGSSREFNDQYADGSDTALDALEAKLRPPPEAKQLPFLVRRMKKDRLTDLPIKTINPIEVTMPPEQADTFRAIVAEAHWTGPSRGSILQVIQNLRSVSLHPLKVERARDMQPDDYVRHSARLSATIKILENIRAKGEKALVFLESLDLQDWLAGYLRDHFSLARRPFVINGGVPGAKRQDMVDDFQEGPDGFDVMILSPKAGGVGLTLTAANHVIHLSRWWNPAVEDQATDRVFRIGQTRPVTVHLPLALHPDEDLRSGSFDLKLHDLLERKRNLSQRLLAPADPNTDSLQDLFDGVVKSTGVERASDASSPTANADDKPSAISEKGQPATSGDVEPAVPKPSREILSVKTVAPSNEAARPLREDWHENYSRSFAPDASRDIVLSFLDGAEVSRVLVQDRYGAIPANRSAMIDLLASMVAPNAAASCRLTILYYGVQAQVLRGQYKTHREGELKDALYREISQMADTGVINRIKTDLRPHTPPPNSIHDRIIRFQIEANGDTRTYKVTLPNGIKGWLDGSQTGDISVRTESNAIWNTV